MTAITRNCRSRSSLLQQVDARIRAALEPAAMRAAGVPEAPPAIMRYEALKTVLIQHPEWGSEAAGALLHSYRATAANARDRMARNPAQYRLYELRTAARLRGEDPDAITMADATAALGRELAQRREPANDSERLQRAQERLEALRAAVPAPPVGRPRSEEDRAYAEAYRAAKAAAREAATEVRRLERRIEASRQRAVRDAGAVVPALVPVGAALREQARRRVEAAWPDRVLEDLRAIARRGRTAPLVARHVQAPLHLWERGEPWTR